MGLREKERKRGKSIYNNKMVDKRAPRNGGYKYKRLLKKEREQRCINHSNSLSVSRINTGTGVEVGGSIEAVGDVVVERAVEVVMRVE